ncbi:MvdC/MvdD family ATP grasp protein [Streptomyces sp. NPDC000941]
MTAPVLIIAAADDWPTDRVVSELTDRGAEVFRMDTAEFPQGLSLGARIDQAQAWAGELATEFRTVDLSRVGAVYYRAPGAFQFPDGMTGPEERFAAAQARAGVGGVLSALACRWVNHPTAMARAEYKPVQLAVARACGLPIPPTLITNRDDAVREFAAEIPGPLICKPVASPVLIEDGAGSHTPGSWAGPPSTRRPAGTGPCCRLRGTCSCHAGSAPVPMAGRSPTARVMRRRGCEPRTRIRLSLPAWALSTPTRRPTVGRSSDTRRHRRRCQAS